jgi:hypothetical protein
MGKKLDGRAIQLRSFIRNFNLFMKRMGADIRPTLWNARISSHESALSSLSSISPNNCEPRSLEQMFAVAMRQMR